MPKTRDELRDILTDYVKGLGIPTNTPLSAPQVARVLGMKTRQSVHDAVARGELKPSLRIGVRRRPTARFTIDDLLDYQELLLQNQRLRHA